MKPVFEYVHILPQRFYCWFVSLMHTEVDQEGRLELMLCCQYEANMVIQPHVKDWMCACVLQLQKWADLLVIAPLSANTMAKMANGICDNLLVCNLLQYSI